MFPGRPVRSAAERLYHVTWSRARLDNRQLPQLLATTAFRDDRELGRGFEVGHSYFVPDNGDEPKEDWYRHIVDTQIAPLLREYWFDSPEIVQEAMAGLTDDA